MGNKSKKHHYVPQSVLQGFSSDLAKRRIYVFDKSKMHSFNAAIRDSGCENQFNTIEVEGKPISLEGIFQTNDDEVARLLLSIRTHHSLAQLTARDRVRLCEVIAAQIIRIKLMRTTLQSFARQLSNSIQEAGIDPGEIDGFSIPTDQEIRRMVLGWFFNLEPIVESLQQKRLILIHSDNLKVFWASDNPVVLHNSFPYGERGLSAPGIEIYLPISSNLIVGLLCPSIELKIKKILSVDLVGVDHNMYQDLANGLQQGTSVSFGPGAVEFFNELQVISSTRFLYSSNDDFAHARDILKTRPQKRNIQTLTSVGRLGEWPNLHPTMPAGSWVVFYGNLNHYMIVAQEWNNNSAFFEFKTTDEATLCDILNDQSINKAILIEDGFERVGMQNVQVESLTESAPFRVRVSHRDHNL